MEMTVHKTVSKQISREKMGLDLYRQLQIDHDCNVELTE